MIERYGRSRLVPAVLESFLHRAIENHDDIFQWANANIPDRLCTASFQEVIADSPAVVARIRAFCSEFQ